MTLKVLKYNVVNETCKQMYWSLSNEIVALRKAFFGFGIEDSYFLTSESIKGTALPLEGIDNIHSGNSFPLGMFSVGNSISDDILKENLKNSTSLLIDESRDTLDSSTTSQPPDCRLGDTLDVVSQHLPVPLGASLSESLASFASSGHVSESVDDQ